MKPHFSDPEAFHELNMRKIQRDAEWLKGQIGEATYLCSLMILGYLPGEAKTELNLLKLGKVDRLSYDFHPGERD